MNENTEQQEAIVQEQQGAEPELSIDELQEQLKQANSTIKELKQSLYQNKMDNFLKSLRIRDGVYERFIREKLEESKLQFNGDTLEGGEELVSELKKEYPNAFAPDPNERAAAPTSSHIPFVRAGKSAFERGFCSSTGFPMEDEPNKNTCY